MAVGLPLKTTYANGDVYSASDVNDTNGTINLIGQTNNFYAGKNKIINGNFGVWQRGTSFSLSSGAYTYVADRFQAISTFSAGSSTLSQQTFTPGTAPASGYEGQYFARLTCGTVASVWGYRNNIEDVRTFAGQTVTLSFWIKASAANATTSVEVSQIFGTGGSGNVTNTYTGPSITTSWQRFSLTVAIPSISGKTIGTSSYLSITAYSTTSIATSLAVDTWGWQLESGSTATAFQTSTGSIDGELASCQRYYFKHPATGGNSPITNFIYYSSTTTLGTINFPVTMRTAPTLSVVTGTGYYQLVRNGGADDINTLVQDNSNAQASIIYNNTESSGTAGQAAILIANNASASIAWSAEL